MSQVREQVDIDAPPEQVFAFFDDPANAPVLLPNLIEVTAIEKVPTGGRRVEYTTRNRRGAIVEASSEHLEYDPPHRTVTQGQQSGVTSTATREFVPVAGGTRVVATIEWSAPVKYLATIISSPLRRPLRRSLRHALDAAKSALEAG